MRRTTKKSGMYTEDMKEQIKQAAKAGTLDSYVVRKQPNELTLDDIMEAPRANSPSPNVQENLP